MTSVGFVDFRSHIGSTALATIADRWHHAAGNKRMPIWDEINPSWISPALKRVFAFNFDRASGAITRAILAGPHPEIARGTALQNLQDPRLAIRMHLTVSRVVLGPAFYRGTGKLFKQGAHIVEGERIVLPMSRDGIISDGALGASDYDDLAVEDSIAPVEVLHDTEEWFSL